MVKLVDLKGEWAAAIGKAFVAFGSIEHVTVLCLKNIPRDRIQRSTSTFRLTARIDLILELLEGHSGEAVSELSEKLTEAKTLAKTRNMIAHNPLVLDVYQNAVGSSDIRELIVSLQRQNHEITLSELQAFAERSERLSEELFGSALDVFKALQQ